MTIYLSFPLSHLIVELKMKIYELRFKDIFKLIEKLIKKYFNAQQQQKNQKKTWQNDPLQSIHQTQ